MAAVASESEQVADLANAEISAEDKPADEKPVEEVTKDEEGTLFDELSLIKDSCQTRNVPVCLTDNTW